MRGASHVFQVGEFAVALSRRLPTDPRGLSVDEKQKALAWAPPTATAGPPMLQITVQLDETTRQQALQSLSALRTTVTRGVGPQQPPGATPATPPPPVQMIGQYFDLLETLVKALDRIEIQGEVSDQAIRLSTRIQALAGSDLAKSFSSPNLAISDLADQLDPKSAVSLAAALGASPAGNQLLKRVLEMSLQVQGATLDEKAVSQYSRLIDSLAPLRFVGSMDFGKGFLYSGIYEFPGQDVKQVHAAIMETLTNVLPAMTGTTKPYSSVEFKEGFRTVGDVPLNRLTTGLNVDLPALQAPGVRELLNLMSAGGRMEMEYAVKEGRLYIGSPDKMTEALGQSPRSSTSAALDVTSNTVLFGRANVLMLMKQMLSNLGPSLPFPPDISARLDRLNTEGADIRFGIDLDGQLSGRLEVPLKLLERIREMQP
jgi:hypothetical protein